MIKGFKGMSIAFMVLALTGCSAVSEKNNRDDVKDDHTDTFVRLETNYENDYVFDGGSSSGTASVVDEMERQYEETYKVEYVEGEEGGNIREKEHDAIAYNIEDPSTLFIYSSSEKYDGIDESVDIMSIPMDLAKEHIVDSRLGAMLYYNMKAFCEDNELDFDTLVITRQGASEYMLQGYYTYKMGVSGREVYVCCDPDTACYIDFLDDLLEKLDVTNGEEQWHEENEEAVE